MEHENAGVFEIEYETALEDREIRIRADFVATDTMPPSSSVDGQKSTAAATESATTAPGQADTSAQDAATVGVSETTTTASATDRETMRRYGVAVLAALPIVIPIGVFATLAVHSLYPSMAHPLVYGALAALVCWPGAALFNSQVLFAMRMSRVNTSRSRGDTLASPAAEMLNKASSKSTKDATSSDPLAKSSDEANTSQDRKVAHPSLAAYPAGLFLVAPYIPFVGVAASVALAALHPNFAKPIFAHPFFAGAVIAVVVWLLAPIFLRSTVSSKNANPRNFELLDERQVRLAARLAKIKEGTLTEPVQCQAYHGAQLALKSFNKAVDEPGSQWIRGWGYDGLWTTLHNAEEQLFYILPTEEVLREAKLDRLRVQGSGIQKEAELLRDLRVAATVLDPNVTPWFQDVSEGATSDPARTSDPAKTSSFKQLEARGILGGIHRTITRYRDKQWEAVLRYRNRLLVVVIFTEIGAYALLWLAVAALGLKGNATLRIPPVVVSGLTFFAIGAVIGGLFSMLSSFIDASTADVEDYGLSMARLLATPVYSGLAAVAGVPLTYFLVKAAQVGASEAVTSLPSLNEAFSVTVLTVIIAALFGILPSRLVQGLTSADTALKNIKSTQATSDSV